MTYLQLIPAKVRTVLYVALGALVLAEGATAAAFGAINHDIPKWLIAVTAATAYVGGVGNFTASANVTPDNAPAAHKRKAARVD